MKNIKSFIFFILAALMLFVNSGGIVLAGNELTDQDILSVLRETPLYDPNPAANDCAVPSNTMSNSKVYVVGDSYSEGLESLLRDKLKTAGYEIVGYNGHTGRSVNGGGNDPSSSGMQALDGDQTAIQEAGTVLVVLGTNPEAYDKTIPLFMKKMNSVNSSSRKFWINAGNNDPTLQDNVNQSNKAIAKYATEFNYSVIDWRTAQQADKSLMPSGVGQFHPNPKGYGVMSDMVVAAFGAAASNGTTRSSVGTLKSAKTPEGNATQIWSYLIGKGFTPIQAAGLMGNLQAESAFMPDRVQGRTVENGSATFDMAWLNNKGYGIAQWTSGGRQQNLLKAAKSSGVLDSDLLMQLNFLMKELESASYKSALNELKSATTITDATKPILYKFEAPKNFESKLVERARLSEQVLKKYGGIAGISVSGCNGSLRTVSGKGGWDLEGSSAMTYYSQYDPKYSSYTYGRTIEECGCGPTSMAMIVATLNSDPSINPKTMADYYTSAGMLAEGCGTSHDFNKPADKFGLKMTSLGTDFAKATEILNAGGLVLMSVGNGSDTLFTSGKHQMVLRKVSDDGATFYVANPIKQNPNDKQNTTGYSTDQLVLDSPSGGSLNEMWGFTK